MCVEPRSGKAIESTARPAGSGSVYIRAGRPTVEQQGPSQSDKLCLGLERLAG
jgi:hypothetical protein